MHERTTNVGCLLAWVLLITSAVVAAPARATAFSADQSDLWYLPDESGWGIELVQRGSVIFGTMFVYGPTGAPTWYVATMSSADGAAWMGDMYATTGPWLGAVPFDPRAVTVRKVGTMNWAPQTLTMGALGYTVDGVAVTKSLVRETLVLDDYSGTYLGAFHATVTGCSDPQGNGSGDVPLTTFTVGQDGSAINVTFAVLGLGSMTISGTLTQAGQFGAVAGGYTDTTGDSGTASLAALNVQANSLAATFVEDSTEVGCHVTGYFAAMRTHP